MTLILLAEFPEPLCNISFPLVISLILLMLRQVQFPLLKYIFLDFEAFIN